MFATNADSKTNILLTNFYNYLEDFFFHFFSIVKVDTLIICRLK